MSYYCYFEKGVHHPYLPQLENVGSDDDPQVNEFKEVGTTRSALVSSRFAIAINLVLFSLLTFIPGTQIELFLHNRDASHLPLCSCFLHAT